MSGKPSTRPAYRISQVVPRLIHLVFLLTQFCVCVASCRHVSVFICHKSECYIELARCIELVFDMWLSMMYPFS